MISALFYLQYHSFLNRQRARLRRLKQPKYLAGAIVGGLYFYFYFFRYLFSQRGHGAGIGLGLGGQNPALFEEVGALVLLGLALMSWILPRKRAALMFTEAEVNFLFPAPVTRRTLIHFKLLKSQTAILFTTFFLTLVTGRFGRGGGAWIHAAGWWLILSSLNLHFLGASFARTMLLERGVSNWQRRAAVLLLVTIGTAAIFLWARRTVPAPTVEDWAGVEAIKYYARRTLESGPAPYLLWPFRMVLRPYLASDALAFFRALGPVLALMALHYWWIIRADVAFEEASVELARKTAERAAAVRRGNWQATSQKRRRPIFQLHPTGFQPVALVWKNLIATGQAFSLRTWILLALIALPVCFALAGSRDHGWRPVLGMGAVVMAAWSLFLGPQILRQDLRQDLPVADILKMYPMRGWQVVLGEVLTPTIVLIAAQWFLLLVVVVTLTHLPGRGVPAIPLATRLAFGLGAALVLPTVNLISLLIPNGAVLLFPAWFQTGHEGPRGIEATGQRLIFMLGQVLVFAVALLPAALAFTAIFLVVNFFAGLLPAVPLAALAASLLLAVEAGLAVAWLGRLFERFDLSAETPA